MSPLRLFRALAPGLVCALLSLSARAAPVPLVVADFTDPSGDGHGPGSYQLPTDGGFQEGDFDLRRFTVSLDGDEVILEVTLGANLRRPEVTQRDNSSPISLTAGLYLQNVDIYIDQSRAPGSGYSTCIPGRRIAFAGGRTWETAIVLTPQPGPAREVIESVLGAQTAAHVIVPDLVEARGRTLIVRLPVLALGGRPTRDWGWSVQVSGARWERSFAVADRVRGSLAANAYTMEVQQIPDTWAFGGGPEGSQHPRVLDVLLPPGAEQRAVLSSQGEAAGDFAKVPFVDVALTGNGPATPPSGLSAFTAAPGTPASPGPGAATSPAGQALPSRSLILTPTSPVPPPATKNRPGPELTVAFVAGELVSLSGLAHELKAMQFGRVFGPDGALVARVVIVQLVEGGAVASAVDNREKIKPGMKVKFEGK